MKAAPAEAALWKSPRAWSLLLLAAVLLAWEWAAAAFAWSQLVLPAPSAVAASLWRGLHSGYFWPHIAQTTLEVLAGLALGGAFGFACGLALGVSAFGRRVLMPYVVASQVVPKLALAPLLIVWLGFGTLPMVVITALVCFFPLLESTLTGIAQADISRLELFRMLGATRWQTLWRLKVPSGLPGILAGFRMAVVLALVGAVVGEFIGGNQGLGAVIIAAQGSMDTPLMFAALALITAEGLLLYLGAIWLQKRLLRPYAAHHSGKNQA
ncbi:ABC transporter permease [Pollutimonas bauzanensis]|uniref:NitT/TauT family transport system permease protein n=1 Tax=Pollutimonas bauzanensis TaxID=658167 RepID=A0A1M5M165_9BURK|nr:ABC transporter permease [Pollutimonas bauzanensis]SHG71104.1 NitT/TauT family transport system permease protein [Pollutimonas bauzanensis]